MHFNSLHFSLDDCTFTCQGGNRRQVHKRGAARTELYKAFKTITWLFTVELTFLPRKPIKNTLAPRIGGANGRHIVEETVPFLIWNHQMYRLPATLQIYRHLIILDLTRALLSALSAASGYMDEHSRININSTKFKNQIRRLSRQMLENQINKLVGGGSSPSPLFSLKTSSGHKKNIYNLIQL